MDRTYPIYTVETECQDCYKCLRECPVKAIKVEKGHASVLPELCVCCGHCVQICPAHAKKVRNDLPKVKQLIKSGRPTYVSLAPSWVSEFRNIRESALIKGLKQLGFAGVSETALGAQTVSAATAEILKASDYGLFLSSACPAVVAFIQKHISQYTENITGMLSPVLAHCKMLREKLGGEIAVVMISPCIAKKTEADTHPNLLNAALTFQDLREWLDDARVILENIAEGPEEKLIQSAEEGALYPIEGGMIQTIKAYPGTEKAKAITLSGISVISENLKSLNLGDLNNPVFIEALACQGGCINGPCASCKDACLTGRIKVEEYAKIPEYPLERKPEFEINEKYRPENTASTKYDENMIKNALAQTGKFRKDDELNCGGCGYETCRNFAIAMLGGKAEAQMCVSYLRKQAQKKANALLRCIPSGVVIVDAELKIVECNERFARMFDEGTEYAFDACPGLQGAYIEKIIPFADFFKTVLKTGRDLHRDAYKVGRKLYSVTVFSIELYKTAGAVIFDVTGTELRREQIAQKAREVINKNITAVQEIACLLGEHVADTEIILRSIAEDYPMEDNAETRPEGGMKL